MATTQHFANWVCGSLLRAKYLMFALITSRESLIHSGEGTTVRTIYMPALERLSILLPSVEEQDEIFARVDAALARIDNVREHCTSLKNSQQAVEAAILAKAFRGELVHQDPNDEPASVLLERIRTESGVQPKQNSRRRK